MAKTLLLYCYNILNKYYPSSRKKMWNKILVYVLGTKNKYHDNMLKLVSSWFVLLF